MHRRESTGCRAPAALTRTIKLGTGIIILPQRQPAVLAKQVASLDVLSGGRLLLGIGVGYLEPEFRALGVPLADRGRRADEFLEAVQWSVSNRDEVEAISASAREYVLAERSISVAVDKWREALGDEAS